MQRFFILILLIICGGTVAAQVTITASDMPTAGDTLRYSNVSPTNTGINTSIAGADLAWNYILTPISQSVDTYQTAISVNPLYALTVGVSAYGYKIADSIPGLGAVLPISIQQLYNFFEVKTGPSRFQVKALGASVSGLPIAANYAPPDVLYFLPLAYQNADTSAYGVGFSLPSTGGFKEQGTRFTVVDGWGTIQTPYYTTPVGCLRIRSEIHEIDSVTFSGTTVGLPRDMVDYKWLVNGDHYPALWVTSAVIAGNEIMTSVKYRDKFIPALNPTDSTTASVRTVTDKAGSVLAYPVPTAADGVVHLSVPTGWTTFVVEVFDMQAREVGVYTNERELDLHLLPAGQYIGRVTSQDKITFVRIVR